MRLDRSSIRSGIVIFWAIWFAIVFFTNMFDGLKELGILPPKWRFASGNYQFMLSVTARYQTPKALTAIMFLGVVLWEGLASALFLQTVFRARAKSNRVGPDLHRAFALGLALSAAFVLADEIFIAYEVEASHMRLFIAQLVSLLFLELVPND